jgi:hypothetical protein
VINSRRVLLTLLIGLCALWPLPTQAACTQRIVAVVVQTVVVGVRVPVVWSISPPCDVIETGLLMGVEPATLAPVGQPIYGYRAAYQQEIRVGETGRYFIAAYVRDEAGGVIQSEAQAVFVAIPPGPVGPSGSHGAPPQYTETDEDFLRQAGNPHFASLRSLFTTGEGKGRQIGPQGVRLFGDASRMVASTRRDEVLAQQAQQLVVEGPGVTFDVTSGEVQNALTELDLVWGSVGFPRSGVYLVFCVAQAMRDEQGNIVLPSVSCVPGPRRFSPPEVILAPFTQTFQDTLAEVQLGGVSTSVQSAIRSGLTYFIPGAPLRSTSGECYAATSCLSDWRPVGSSAQPQTTGDHRSGRSHRLFCLQRLDDVGFHVRSPVARSAGRRGTPAHS